MGKSKKKSKYSINTPPGEQFREEIIKKYICFVQEHNKEVVKKVTEKFNENRDDITREIFRLIAKKAENAKHYIWEPDNCSYDHSGLIKEDGTVDKGITIREFLENEYTGNKIATYESGCGFSYNTFDDEISYDTLDIAYRIMKESVTEQLRSFFKEDIDEKNVDIAFETIYDDVYVDSPAYNFFSCVGALDSCHADIDNTTIGDLIGLIKKSIK